MELQTRHVVIGIILLLTITFSLGFWSGKHFTRAEVFTEAGLVKQDYILVEKSIYEACKATPIFNTGVLNTKFNITTQNDSRQ